MVRKGTWWCAVNVAAILISMVAQSQVTKDGYAK
jgi:hypothetical protein